MKEITINNIIGLSPFNIFLCDEQALNCFWVGVTTDTSFVFIVPSPYDELSDICIKIIDGNGCAIKECINIDIV